MEPEIKEIDLEGALKEILRLEDDQDSILKHLAYTVSTASGLSERELLAYLVHLIQICGYMLRGISGEESIAAISEALKTDKASMNVKMFQEDTIQ